MLKLIG
jgi:hypothetical protein